jgi:hypothetical protein
MQRKATQKHCSSATPKQRIRARKQGRAESLSVMARTRHCPAMADGSHPPKQAAGRLCWPWTFSSPAAGFSTAFEQIDRGNGRCMVVLDITLHGRVPRIYIRTLVGSLDATPLSVAIKFGGSWWSTNNRHTSVFFFLPSFNLCIILQADKVLLFFFWGIAGW